MAARRRGRLRLTARGWFLGVVGAGLVVVAGVFSRSDALFAGSVLVLAVLVATAGLALRPRPGPMTRTVPAGAVPAGSRVAVALSAVPGAGLPGPDPVEDLTPTGLVAAEATLTPGVLAYQWDAERRGVFPLGPAVVHRVAPLGMATRVTAVAPASELVVAPRLVTLEIPPLRFDADEAVKSSTPSLQRITDPSAVRDYQAGDPRRLVHWRATARRDRLMVRDEVRHGSPDIWVLVDTVAPEAPEADEAFELGISAAASLVRRFTAAGHLVRIASTGAGAGLGVDGVPDHFASVGSADAVMEAFARIRPVPEDAPDWPEALTQDWSARAARVPLFGACVQASPQRLAAMGRAAALGNPACVWLAGAAAGDARALAGQGWEVQFLGRGGAR